MGTCFSSQQALLSEQLSCDSQELERCKQQVAQLQSVFQSGKRENDHLRNQLQDVKLHCQNQNADICNLNDRLRSRVSLLEAQLLAAPPNSSLPHSIVAQCSGSIVSGKNRRHEQYLRDLFNRHKDASGGLCGQNLVQALRDVDAPNIPTSDQEVADIIKQFDANSNGVLEFGEFRQAVNDPDELQVWLSEKQLPLAADALRPLVGRGDDQLIKMSLLSPAGIDHAAAAACAIIPGMLQELHLELQRAFAVKSQIEADMKADPSKFNDFYKMACGSISDFHKGLTGRVGMPHLNFKSAMQQEHCERAGCVVEFTTGNYKITTTPKREWQYVVENVLCPDMGHARRLVPISNLMQLNVSQNAKLREEEVIAIVLYTGPMFQIYNTILRRYPDDKFATFRDGDNLFSTTIFVLVSAVQKLSRFTRIPFGTLLYRGLGGKMDLPEIFFQMDDYGCSGYAEWGFLSTTSDIDVALGYSGVKERRPKAIVMVIETSSIDRGADISEFSQYPGEKEFLYLPCSFVQRVRQGNGRVQVVDGGLVTFVSAKVNLNIKTQTVEELQEQKKSLHMVSAKSILSEVQFELTDFVQSSTLQGVDLTQCVGNITKFVDDIMGKCRKVVESHEQMDAQDFVDDETHRRLINELWDTKLDAIHAKEWQQTRMQLRKHDFGKATTCIATLELHSGCVNSVAFHPTAPILATGSTDSTVKLWRVSSDLSSVACLATLAGHSKSIKSVAFHPTAPILVTGSSDDSVKLWRLSSDNSSATCVATLEVQGHGGSVNSVAFHPTAPILATGSSGPKVELFSFDSETINEAGTTKLWLISPDQSSATCLATLEGHSKSVQSVAFHPTAPILATGSSDSTVKLWRVSSDHSSATCLATLAGHSESVQCVAFHPAAPILATGSDDSTVKLWRLTSDNSSAACFATLEGNNGCVYSVAFHPTAPILATGSSNQTLKLWRISSDQSSATCVATLQTLCAGKGLYGLRAGIFDVAFHPTAPILAGATDAAMLWH